MAQTFLMVAGTEAEVKDAAAGGSGTAQDGQFHEGCRVGRPQPQPAGLPQPLGLRGRQEAQGRRRVGRSARTGGPDGRRTAGRAAGDAEDAVAGGALGTSEPTFERVRTCS